VKDADMQGNKLLILSIVDDQKGQAYGPSIVEEVKRKTGKKMLLSNIYAYLKELQDLGLVLSGWSDPQAHQGGKSRRTYSISRMGMKVLVGSLKPDGAKKTPLQIIIESNEA
jgi:DNA-binding PadR family transcriptional regulator